MGKRNLDADGLSRRPHVGLTDDPVSQKERERIQQFIVHHSPEGEFSTEVMRAVCDKHLVQIVSEGGTRKSPLALVESLSVTAEAIPDSYEQTGMEGVPVIEFLSEENLKDKQKSDPPICEVIYLLDSGETPPQSVKAQVPELKMMLHEVKQLEMKNGVLYQRRQEAGSTQYQLVLLGNLRDMVLTSLHNDVGNLGREHTLDLVRSRFCWPRMAAAVEKKVRPCQRCVHHKV